MESPHVRVQKFGQSIWYDNIRRGLITSGELHDLVTNGPRAFLLHPMPP